MKLIAQVKLDTTPEHALALLATLERANEACNALSAWAWQAQVFGQYALHKAQYNDLRAQFPLTAQVVVRCISKVADAYKLDRKTQRTFKPHGSIAYDDRILRWYVERRAVSIWTMQGRITLPFSCGEAQRELLKTRQGESDLVYSNGSFYLLATCNVEEPPAIATNGVIGVDFGITQLAVDSDGQAYSGEPVKQVRIRMRELRRGLQSCGSPSAKRHLSKAKRRQSRFTTWVNHNLSKQLVQSALRSAKALALEDLTGIRQRASAYTKQMRWLLGNWVFQQLRRFVEYKAKRAGVPLLIVEAAYSSQTCSSCGHCERANRPGQSTFHCQQCGFQLNADYNAALNLKARGETVSRPIVSALT